MVLSLLRLYLPFLWAVKLSPRPNRILITVCLLLCCLTQSWAGSLYVYYPFSPNALFQAGMNVSFMSGKYTFYNELPGFGDSGVYNGAFGVTFERTEQFVFVSSADGKNLRKLNYRTTFVGEEITSTYPLNLLLQRPSRSKLASPLFE